MKKKLTVFGLIAFLTIPFTVAVSTSLNQRIAPVDAEGYNDKVTVQKGLFQRVDDISSIQDDEELLILADGRYTLQFFVGASYHYWMTTEFSEFNDIFNDGQFIYANNVKGELVTFDKVDNEVNTYYLKLNHFVDYSFDRGSIKKGYIVHEAYDNSGVTAFGDLFFRESKNKPSENASKWVVSKDAYNHTTITSKSGRQLHYKQCGGYSWSSLIATPHTEWSSNLELYRKVKDTLGSMFTINTEPTKTVYEIGDQPDLSGMRVTVTLPNGEDSFSASYNDKSYLFTNIEFLSYYNAVFFDFCGIRGYVPVTVNNGLSNEHLYLRSDERIVDPRGTYLFGVTGGLNEKHYTDKYYEDLNWTYILNLLRRNIDPGHSEDFYFGEVVPIIPVTNRSSINPISDLTITTSLPPTYEENPVVTENLVRIVLVDGKYYLRGALHYNYLYSNSGVLESSESLPSTANSITIDDDNHILTHNGADIFVVDTTNDINKVKTVSVASLPNANYRPLEMFKLQLNSSSSMAGTVEDTLNAFKTTFYEKTANYKNGVTPENWTTLTNNFNSLSFPLGSSIAYDLQGYLSSIQYNHNKEAANSIKEMIDIYDQIVYLNDGALEDFMGRKTAETLCDYRNVTFNCENCSITGENRVTHYKKSYAAQISINTGTMHYPATIEVLMNGNALTSGTDYTYNNENGAITINSNKITEDITINAVATRFAYHVRYSRNTAIPSYFQETVGIDQETYTLRSPVYTSVYIPEGKEFKCWLVDSEEVDSGETITLTDDVTITPVFKEIKAIEELNYRETVSSLSYDYEVLGENSFEFNNVALRFGGLISKESWDQLDTTFRENEQSRGILGYGVLIYTNRLGDFEQLTPSNATYDLFIDAATKEHPNLASDSVKTANHIVGEDFEKDYYAWNLRVNVGEAHFTSDITAVAYVKTATNGYMYFGQITTSVKKQANEMLLNRGFTDEYDGSLTYLANLQ